ncbi:cyclic nucleotide-binding domain-containing protein [Rhizobium lusitanum]|uniref:cyclic nucleotide-binding domain-containing protein n=1 Tax=Rhizobium lusitanum TaxID=293958 RepID=UPI0013AF6AB9|nr:cyclic nucleotide-binding domain-containing protein [Rhizobium lusitanum]
MDPDQTSLAANPWPGEHGVEPDHIVLSSSDQSELARLADVITFETKGSHVVTQGEPARFLYLLSGGVLVASHMLNHGDRQVVAFYWPGDLFGLAEKDF